MASPTNAAKKGRLLLIKVSGGVSPASYNTLMGVRSRTITINNEQVDITSDDEAPWRKLLEDAGLRTITITASGVNKDDQAQQDLEDRAYGTNAKTIDSFLIQFPNSDILEGEFQVASYERGAEHVGEETWNITLESAGQPTFTRA